MRELERKLVCRRACGFTLIEVLIASVIGLFIAVVMLGSLKAVSVSAEKVEKNIDVASEVRFAARMVAADLANLYRGRRQTDNKFVGTVEGSESGGLCGLTFYTVSRAKARGDQPEGDVYEVEYRLVQKDDKKTLTRRLWPNPDKTVSAESAPRGILTTAADDIDIFDVRYFDGKQWLTEWPQDSNSIPEIVEVTIAAKMPNQRDMAMESFIVNFVRCKGKVTGAFDQEQDESSENESGNGQG